MKNKSETVSGAAMAKGAIKAKADKDLPVFTREEVAKHNTPDDSWIIIEGKVYAVSKFAKVHPGGRDILTSAASAGHDLSDAFRIYHPEYVARQKLPYLCKGVVADDAAANPINAAYRALDAQLRAEGFYETNYFYFAFKFAYAFAMFGLAIWLGLGATTSGMVFASAAMMGLFWQQFAFIGHDLCHNGVSHVRWIDYGICAILGNSLGGISASWWKRSHNNHHVTCNNVQHDADIQHLPVFAVTEKYFGSVFSEYHGRVLPFDAVSRVLVKWQHWLYYPVMALARFNLYLQSIIHMCGSRRMDYRKTEITTEVLFFVWMGLFVWQLPTWKLRLAWLLVSHAVSGILHVQITLSHFAMPVYDDPKAEFHSDEFITAQLTTSMDVDTSWYDNWFHGGLQFQVEHHLFPRIPRHNLKYVRPRLIAFCKEHDLPYFSYSFYEGNKKVIQVLREAASKVDGNLDMIRDGLNAHG